MKPTPWNRTWEMAGGIVCLGALLVLAVFFLQSITGLCRTVVTLRPDALSPMEGFAFAYPANPLGALRNRLALHNATVTENGVPLPFPNATHDEIKSAGKGRYAMGAKNIWFSSTDGSDPVSNGKTYALSLPFRISDVWLSVGWLGLFLGVVLKIMGHLLPDRRNALGAPQRQDPTFEFVLAALLLASWAGVTLTHDGGAYFYTALGYFHHPDWSPCFSRQPDWSPFILCRYVNVLSLPLVGWLADHGDSSIALLQVETFLSYSPTLLSTAAVLWILRGKPASQRWWALAGILIIPLPNMMCPICETNPAMQFTWVLIAALWDGLQRRHAWIVLLAGVLLFSCHPLSTFLFSVVAVLALWSAWTSVGAPRRRYVIFALLLIAAAAGRLRYSMAVVTPFERYSLQLSVILYELKSMLLFTPWLVVPIVLLMAVQRCWAQNSNTEGRRFRFLTQNLHWWLLAAAVIPMLHPHLWAGCMNYRKFGIGATIPIALFAHWMVQRESKRAQDPHAKAPLPTFGSSPAWLAFVFFANISVGALSWKGLTNHLLSAMNAKEEPVLTMNDLPFLRNTALDTWTATFSAFALQGQQPSHLYLANGSTLQPDGVHVPFDIMIINLKNSWFDLEAFQVTGKNKPPR